MMNKVDESSKSLLLKTSSCSNLTHSEFPFRLALMTQRDSNQMEKVVTKANERLAESLQGLYDQESRAQIYKTRCEQINARLAISQRNLEAQRACDQRLAQGRLEQIAAAAKKKVADATKKETEVQTLKTIANTEHHTFWALSQTCEIACKLRPFIEDTVERLLRTGLASDIEEATALFQDAFHGETLSQALLDAIDAGPQVFQLAASTDPPVTYPTYALVAASTANVSMLKEAVVEASPPKLAECEAQDKGNCFACLQQQLYGSYYL